MTKSKVNNIMSVKCKTELCKYMAQGLRTTTVRCFYLLFVVHTIIQYFISFCDMLVVGLRNVKGTLLHEFCILLIYFKDNLLFLHNISYCF